MADYLDYLDWRGDLTFEQSPLNEVDNYILCKIGCPDFTGIIPANGSISISRALELYEASLDEDEDPEDALGPLASPYIIPVLRRLPQTVRFGGIKLCDYINITDQDITEQFSALTVILPDGTRFVTFRGTGDTIVSWKEDFLLSVKDTVPSQRDAAAYLLKQSGYGGRIMVGGHSKGGNLAVYASLKMPPEVQNRIEAIYNNDGPGFRRDLSETPEYKRIKPKLHTIVSQFTMIGKLLYHEDDCTIVRASKSGADAHDGFNWEVLGPEFVKCEDYSMSSKAFEVAINETLGRMDIEQRKKFIEEFFTVLTSTGADTLSDLTEHRLRQAAELSSGIMRESPEVRRFLTTLSSLFIQQTVANAKGAIARVRQSFDKIPKTISDDDDDDE